MKILLATDGSPLSTPAIQAAVRRPWPPGSVVRVLVVVEFPLPIGPEAAVAANFTRLAEEARKDGEQIARSVRETVVQAGLPVDVAVREGRAGREIVDAAKTWGADLILMGSRGRTGLKRALLGSVSEYVVSHATCSVEVVRDSRVET